jgi:branched-chain amino acid transport system permease protein
MKTLAERVAAHRPNPVVALGASLWPLAIGVAVAVVLQWLIAPALGPFYARLLLDIGIAVILAVSLNIVNGFAGQFSIGHAGFMMVGGYAAAWLTYYGSIKLFGTTEVPQEVVFSAGHPLFLVSCLLGGALAALAGLVVGLPSLRLRGDYLAIVTLGFGEIMRVLATRTGDVLYPDETTGKSMFSFADNLGGSLGFSGVPTFTRVFYVYLFVAILLVVAYRLKASTQGRALLAVRENEIAAEAVGINTTKAKVSAFVLAAFFAGIGGALFAHELGTTLSPKELGFQKSIDIVIMVVLGGMGSITGVVGAAAILTLLPELFREFSEYRMIVYALALIIVMIVRPQGLMGIKELWDLSSWQKVFRGRKVKDAEEARKHGGAS